MNLRRVVLPSAGLHLLYPTLALFLAAFAIAPLTYPGFWQSYTGYSAVYNLIDLHNRLAGFFAWSPTWGRAYDFLRMDAPLGYWAAEIFHLLSVSFLVAIKLVYALSFLLSAFGMYKLAQRILQNDPAALLASAIYVYFPAHIAAVYIRGAFGEAVLWGLMPYALWSALEWERRGTRRTGLGCVGTFAALALAQPGLAILFGLLARVWVGAMQARQPWRALAGARSNLLFLGLALGSVIQLPALVPQRLISDSNGFVAAFIYPFQMLSASWGTALPRGNFMEQAPYQIGFAGLGLTILAIALRLYDGQTGEEQTLARRVTWFAVTASIVLMVLMTPLLEGIWDAGLNLFVQYPFQLLAFVGFLLAFAAASVVTADARFQEIPLLTAFVLVPLLAVYPYLAPQFTDFVPTKPALARFNNDELALLDAKIVRPPGTWRHGATVELDLTWQALRQPNRDYTIFLHILDDTGKVWGAVDEKPQEGSPSTLKWIAGGVISDTHAVQIDLHGPPDGYHMEVGLYAGATGERAITETGADNVRIDENQ